MELWELFDASAVTEQSKSINKENKKTFLILAIKTATLQNKVVSPNFTALTLLLYQYYENFNSEIVFSYCFTNIIKQVSIRFRLSVNDDKINLHQRRTV